MAVGYKTPGSGRKKGTLNKRTLEREEMLRKAQEEIAQALNKDKIWDAHSLLIAVYNNDKLSLEVRADAAKAAIRYEKPAKSETTVTDNTRWLVSDGTQSMDEWRDKYAPKKEKTN